MRRQPKLPTFGTRALAKSRCGGNEDELPRAGRVVLEKNIASDKKKRIAWLNPWSTAKLYADTSVFHGNEKLFHLKNGNSFEGSYHLLPYLYIY